jgi:hypothetical protein
MCQLGQSVTLTFDRYSYEVVIHKFELKPRLSFWIPYRIELVPVINKNKPAEPPIAPDNTEASTTQLANGLGNAPGSTLPPFAPPAPSPDPFPLANNTPAPPITIPTAPPVSITNNLTNFQNDLLAALQGQTSIVNNPDLTTQADAIQAQLQNLDTSIGGSSDLSATGLQAFSSYTQSNMSLIQQKIDPETPVAYTIPVQNPNFLALAQQYYGDAGQWEHIANANGFVTSRASGLYTLTIPRLS